MEQRVRWLDVAKGYGIIAVVAGHVTSLPAIHRGVFMFHMPLFFLLAGLTFREVGWRDFGRRRALPLLVPYGVWLVVVTALDFALSYARGRHTVLPIYPHLSPARALGQLVYGGDALKGHYGVFWFVTCLLIVQAMANLALQRLGPPDKVKWPLVCAVAIVAAYLFAMLRFPTPWAIGVAPMAFVFFAIGLALRGRERAVLANPVLLGAAALIAVAGLAWLAPMDMKKTVYGTPLLAIVAAVAITALVCKLAERTDRAEAPAKVLEALGKASLVVMFLHQTIYFDLLGLIPEAAIVVIALLVSVLLWRAATRSALLSMLLLGKFAHQAQPLAPASAVATAGAASA